MHLILFNFFRMVALFLVLSVLVGVLLGNFFGNNENLAKRLLVLSAGFLIAVCVVEVFPQIYNSGNENIGLWVIIGVVLQMVLEGMTKGFEHGHFHYEKCNILPIGLLLGMFIHAFIEGIPLAGMHLDSPYLLGILVHNLPISFVLGAFLLREKKNKLSYAISVTQIHPNHKSFVTDSLHPARKSNGFVKIFQRKFAISMCSKHIFI